MTTLLLLGLAELGSRVAGAPPTGPQLVLEAGGERWPAFTRGDPVLGWRQERGISNHDPIWLQWNRQQGLGRPEDGRVETNERGWRDDAVPPIRPPGARWVLALGDSSVWGSGCPSEARFTEQLETRLAGGAVEVWNAAVPGYSTWQARAVLEETDDLPLDAVLIYNMVSDMGAARGLPDDLWFSSPARQRGAALLSRSRLYGWMRFWVFRARAHQRLARDPDMQIRVHVAQYKRNLEWLIERARDRGLAVVGVVPPLRQDLDEAPARYTPRSVAERVEHARGLDALSELPSTEARTVDYRRAMVLTLDALGVPWVDGPRAFIRARQADPTGTVPLFVDPVHPSERGHRVLADAIAPALADVLGLSLGWQNAASPESP